MAVLTLCELEVYVDNINSKEIVFQLVLTFIQLLYNINKFFLKVTTFSSLPSVKFKYSNTILNNFIEAIYLSLDASIKQTIMNINLYLKF